MGRAAVLEQSEDFLEVASFLVAAGLDRYTSLFLEHGFDCMETVQEMEERHMQAIGMATGHMLKLRKKLRERKMPSESKPFESKNGEMSMGNTKRVAFQSGQDHTPERVSGTLFEGQEAAASFQEALLARRGDTRPKMGEMEGTSLLDGHFDETEAAASFQEALLAWRGGGKAAAPASAAISPQPQKVAGSFWSSMGTTELNVERCVTPVHPAWTDVVAPVPHGPASGGETLCCYHCYKRFYARYAVERSSPLFEGETKFLCSEGCANLWTAVMDAKAEQMQRRREQLERIDEILRVVEMEESPTLLLTGQAMKL